MRKTHGLMAVVVGVAIGLAAIREPTHTWFAIVFVLTSGCFCWRLGGRRTGEGGSDRGRSKTSWQR